MGKKGKESMNREEYSYNTYEHYCDTNHRNKYYNYVQKLLRGWKVKNNIPSNKKCVVHHRDDNEEVRIYNHGHYELWGCEIDENGDFKFEYGKYVVFMTLADHASYHQKGTKNAWYGKHLSEETKKKISDAVAGPNHPNYGKHLSEETKEKIRNTKIGPKNPMYSKCLSDEHKNKIRLSNIGKHHTEEAKRKISEAQKGRAQPEETRIKMEKTRIAYKQYKQTGGKLSWNDFQRAYANNEINIDRL